MKKILFGALLTLFSITAYAGPFDDACFYNCTTEVTNEYYDVGVDTEAFAEAMAATAAMASIQFGYHDGLQIGFGGGTHNGQDAAAVGVAYMFGDSLLVNMTATDVNDHSATGVGATWRF